MDTMLKDPAVQTFRTLDLEVLMLTSPSDELCMSELANYGGRKFVPIQQAVTLELGQLSLASAPTEGKESTRWADMRDMEPAAQQDQVVAPKVNKRDRRRARAA